MAKNLMPEAADLEAEDSEEVEGSAEDLAAVGLEVACTLK